MMSAIYIQIKAQIHKRDNASIQLAMKTVHFSFQCFDVLQSNPCLLHCFNQLTPCPCSILEPEQPTVDGIGIVVGVVNEERLDLCIRQTQKYQQGVSLFTNILGHMFHQELLKARNVCKCEQEQQLSPSVLYNHNVHMYV